ncbi:MAG: hypothetical protein ACE5KH_01090 [Candidatus Geothermarchaeales archaeon]
MRRKKIKEGQEYVSVSIPTKLIRGVDALVDAGASGYETGAEVVKKTPSATSSTSQREVESQPNASRRWSSDPITSS